MGSKLMVNRCELEWISSQTGIESWRDGLEMKTSKNIPASHRNDWAQFSVHCLFLPSSCHVYFSSLYPYCHITITADSTGVKCGQQDWPPATGTGTWLHRDFLQFTSFLSLTSVITGGDETDRLLPRNSPINNRVNCQYNFSVVN